MAATLTDLDNEITSLTGAETSLVQEVQTVVANLIAKINSGVNQDYTPEVTQLQTISTALSNLNTTVAGDDPNTPPPTTPPAPVDGDGTPESNS